MAQISNIIDGWEDYINGKTSNVTRSRAVICKECDYAKKGFFEMFMPDESLKEVQGLKCTRCNCPLSTKLRSENETCPLDKWV